MHISLVMTIIGADRPGLVGRLSAAIAEHGGNWLESRMAHLGGQFAGILRVDLPADNESKLLNALRTLDAQGLSVHVQRDSAAPSAASRNLAVIELVGHDRPGIVRQISQILAEHQVNVEELVTHCASAPMSAEMLFHATATVRLPESFPLARLRAALEEIASDLMVDISVMPDHV
ncbi:MAG: ACT domain-containing protein [Verrucomicrobia bacterium]|nr:ACT domain-containing protein [Verrucomicrobiota bacterium]